MPAGDVSDWIGIDIIKLLKLVADDAQLSHEQLAVMLGVTVREISDTIAGLEQKGIIRGPHPPESVWPGQTRRPAYVSGGSPSQSSQTPRPVPETAGYTALTIRSTDGHRRRSTAI